MATDSVTVTTDTSAPVERVWHLLATIDTWPAWAPVQGAELERPGAPDPDGPGAVRRLRTPLGVTREEVVEAEAPHRLVYTLLSGLPLRDYRSEVTLAPDPAGTGTTITWRSTFRGGGPAGWLRRALVRSVLARFAGALARGTASSSTPGGDAP